ncbi:alpha/beta hydrolase [Caproicibacter fermentans]|uniref:Alpha/beta hydrolase n=1 Tax=Caproicibacter fermentans TaxID=2576756 RepID=A0A7G8TG05_9FIRM|nr:alpha/beta hydrolase [Caproicibacter fermentans]
MTLVQTLCCPDSSARLDCYPASSERILPAVVICPGGGYSWLSPRESGPVAEMFRQNGFHAFVLRYTVENPPLGFRPLRDLSWAVKEVRESSGEPYVDPHRIAVCGFSAGGHLAASLGVFWNNKDIFPDASLWERHRPNALILGYPVISSGPFAHRESFERLFQAKEKQSLFSLEKQVSDNVPPTFLWHTVQDGDVPVQNSMLFFNALVEHHIPCELHLFPKGVHGLSLATPEVEEPEKGRFADPHVASWSSLCVEWMHQTFIQL